MYRVAIVDDHSDLRALLGMLLDASPGFEVCGTGESGLDAIRLAEQVRPDVMLLDLSMPGMDGYEALPPILDRSPATRVVILTGHELASCERQVAELGAVGCLEKSVRMTDLADRLLHVLDRPKGGAMTDFEVVPDLSALVIEARSTVGPIAFGASGLTGRVSGVISAEGGIDLTRPATASLVVSIAALTSGNALYDAEIRDRLDARRFPLITAELLAVSAAGDGRLGVSGDLTIHGTTRRQSGTIDISVATEVDDDALRLVAAGTQIVDVRDFNIELPSVLLMQIYPDVTVRYRVIALAAAPASDALRSEN